MRRVRLAVWVVAIAVSLHAPAAFAAPATTAPSKTVLVYFVFTDQKLVYGIYRTSTAGNNELYIENSVSRGDFAKFTVINRGKKTHGFAFMGKTIVLKPGMRKSFNKFLGHRGRFAYRSTTDSGKSFSGLFPVY